MYDVFISSPIDGFEEYREAARIAADISGPAFNVFLYEMHRHKDKKGSTTTERIMSTFGHNCDVFIVFFKDRVGRGTIEEFTHFEEVFNKPPNYCELFWAKIAGPSNGEIQEFIDKLVAHEPNGMTALESSLCVKTPADLTHIIAKNLSEFLFQKLQEEMDDKVECE